MRRRTVVVPSRRPGGELCAFDLYLARLTRYGAPARDEGIVEVRLVTPAELESLITAGEISDSFTLGAFLQARLRGLI